MGISTTLCSCSHPLPFYVHTVVFLGYRSSQREYPDGALTGLGGSPKAWTGQSTWLLGDGRSKTTSTWAPQPSSPSSRLPSSGVFFSTRSISFGAVPPQTRHSSGQSGRRTCRTATRSAALCQPIDERMNVSSLAILAGPLRRSRSSSPRKTDDLRRTTPRFLEKDLGRESGVSAMSRIFTTWDSGITWSTSLWQTMRLVRVLTTSMSRGVAGDEDHEMYYTINCS